MNPLIIVIFDIGTFLILPWIFFKDFKLAIIFFFGFLLTQLTIPYNRWIEYMFEVMGVLLILLIFGWVKNEV